MKYAHNIKLNVFSYENEDSDEILGALTRFFPFSLGENKVKASKSTATGFNESKIRIFEVILTKTSLINKFLDFILESLDESKKGAILQQAESRLDDSLHFFIRFDKEEWIRNNRLELTDSGKCFHLKMSVASFPKNRNAALKIIRELFTK